MITDENIRRLRDRFAQGDGRRREYDAAAVQTAFRVFSFDLLKLFGGLDLFLHQDRDVFLPAFEKFGKVHLCLERGTEEPVRVVLGGFQLPDGFLFFVIRGILQRLFLDLDMLPEVLQADAAVFSDTVEDVQRGLLFFAVSLVDNELGLSPAGQPFAGALPVFG